MKAPEKLYLHPTAKGEVGASWLTFSLTNEDIEYTRNDAFIEKASEYLEPILTEYAGFYVGGYILQHFKNYMRGE